MVTRPQTDRSLANLLRRDWALAAFAALVGLVPAVSLLNAQFRGEDEILVLTATGQIVDGLRAFDPIAMIKPVLTADQPPGRHLLPVPFVWLLGRTELALRLPNVLAWAAAVAVAALVGRRLGGVTVGVFTALLLGLSSLYDFEAMGHGHGVATLAVLLAVLQMVAGAGWGLPDRDARRRYIRGGAACAAGFLWFTSMLPVAGMYHALHGIAALRSADRRQAIRAYIVTTLPFVAFYAAYYAIFFGVPAYAVRTGLAPAAFGQLAHNQKRLNTSALNVESLVLNLGGLNWFFVPYASWVIVGAGMVYQARRYPGVFALLLPYAALFSFYLQHQTSAHFLAYAVWLAPFGVAALLATTRPHLRRAMIAILAVVTVGTAVWTYVGHVRRYTAQAFPEHLVTAVNGDLIWRNNVNRPLDAIERDLRSILGKDDRFVVTADGALPLYYFRDPRYLGEPVTASATDPVTGAPCQRVVQQAAVIRAGVSPTAKPFCADQVESVRRYPGADLMVTVFRRPPQGASSAGAP